jgi:hypothetical protein
MNGRGDSQQHPEYATRLFDWPLGEWTHTVTPMADPYPAPSQMSAYYSNALRWVGRVRDFQVPTPDARSHIASRSPATSRSPTPRTGRWTTRACSSAATASATSRWRWCRERRREGAHAGGL